MITSKANKLVKTVKSLQNKKYRDKLSLFSVEGNKLILELSKVKRPEYLIVKEDIDIKDTFGSDIKVYVVNDIVFKYLSSEKSPQGVIAVFEKSIEKDIDNLKVDNCLFLDNVQDASNVGGLIRSSVCTGFDTCICFNSADVYSMKALRASAGAVFHINIVKEDNYDILDSFLEKGYDLIASDIRGDEDISFKRHNNILIVGNEGKGINKELLKKSNKVVKIPMTDKIDSLNASVSGAILMYKIKGYFNS